MQRSISTFVDREEESSTMEMVALQNYESQGDASLPSQLNNDEPIRALIYTTCYNVLDG